MRKHRLGMAIVCLHISAVLYLLIGVLMFPLFLSLDDRGDTGMIFAVFMFLFCLVLIVGIEFVAAGLANRRYWAWIAGICIFGMYATSLFLPLGALGLWGLLDPDSREEIERTRGNR